MLAWNFKMAAPCIRSFLQNYKSSLHLHKYPAKTRLSCRCETVSRNSHTSTTQQLHGKPKLCLLSSLTTRLAVSRPSVIHYRLSRSLTTQASESEEEEYHSIIKDTEKPTGASDTLQFQAETKQLLNIVARSLYSEKEVFIREIISNASDALEKLRYLQLTSDQTTPDGAGELEIHIAVDDGKKTFTIQDTGVGMTRDELINNLGCIARSGSKAFLESLGDKAGSDVSSNMIGQFGVGFYSTFMVADKVEVFSKSHEPNSTAFRWSSDGTGMYEVSEAEGVQQGTKIVIHLKGDCYDYAKEDKVKEIIERYSNFVGVPIFVNGKRINVIQALWTMEPKDVTTVMHEDFYRFTANSMDKPRYHLHYKTDAPLNIRALFYVPEYKPTLFDMSRETDLGVALYSRKVMVMSRANNILPRWLRFVKGVVDSEDVPLNLSRELLQDSSLIRKLRDVLTRRLIRFLIDQSKKDKVEYMKFYEDYGMFFREGIVTTMEQEQREEIAKLMRFESSHQDPGVKVSIDEYVSRMKAGSRDIYYLSAPSRQLAETSPYYEAFKKRDVEVLFLYEQYDELVLMNLSQFDRKNLRSIENMTQGPTGEEEAASKTDEVSDVNKDDFASLIGWMKVVLTNKIKEIKVTSRLESHPCVVTVAEMGAARHFLKTTMMDKSQEERFRMLQPTLEINPDHALIKKVSQLQQSDPDLARLLTEQLYENAMIHAGLVDDPRSAVSRLNDLLVKALDKH